MEDSAGAEGAGVEEKEEGSDRWAKQEGWAGTRDRATSGGHHATMRHTCTWDGGACNEMRLSSAGASGGQ